MGNARKRIETFRVSSLGREHVVCDEKCNVEWCDGGTTYPKKCKCGGLIHAEFGDEDSDCNYYIIMKCDTCGDRSNG